MARAPVSKTGGWGFESLHSCQGQSSRQMSPQFSPQGSNQISRRRLIHLAAAACGLTLLPSVADRQALSQAPKTIRFIVPFPPGGGADLLMRVLAKQIGRIVVNAASPFHTLADLVETARAKPGQLTNASVGPATTQHIAFELFKLRAKIKMIYVSFNGNGPAINELLGGHVNAVMANYAEAAENIKAGNLRALAVGSPARLEWMPEIPTIAESGYPGYEVSVWYGLFAPAGTPPTVIDRLGQWCSAAMLAPELKPKLALHGLEPVGKPAAELASHPRAQQEEYGRVIREADIQAE
jgi:tripartite-type tricarboxylate transporter receptor subunit TctC